jgi:hypothetical protein
VEFNLHLTAQRITTTIHAKFKTLLHKLKLIIISANGGSNGSLQAIGITSCMALSHHAEKAI